jgi:hypothetical protein
MSLPGDTLRGFFRAVGAAASGRVMSADGEGSGGVCCEGGGGVGTGMPCAMSSSENGAGSMGEVRISAAVSMRNEGVEYWILRPSYKDTVNSNYSRNGTQSQIGSYG